MTKSKVRDHNTREELQPDEAFLKSIEEQIAIIGSAADGFRQEVIAYLWASSRRGERITYTAYEPLKEAIERKLMNSVRELSRIITKARTRDEEQQQKYDTMVQNLIEGGYCEDSVDVILKYAANHLWRDLRRARPPSDLTGEGIERMAIFRPYSSSDALRSDRSAGDRQRHREKLREAIRDNIADIISEESIIGRDRDRIIKVPIRGIREYRFVFGDNQPQVGSGDGETEPGQVVGKAPKDGEGAGRAGDQPGVDYYETDVTLDELIEIMFEDLELPDMERKILREVMSDRIAKRKGYRRAGVRVHLDRRRTAKARIRRKIATHRA